MTATSKVCALTAENKNIRRVAPAVTIAILTMFGGVSAPPAQAVPTVGMNGLVPNAAALAHYIRANYPSVQSIGGVRADRLPDHPSGHAIDIMIGTNMALGDRIKADIQAQSGKFGVKYILWRVADHYNHVHVTVY